MVYVGDQISHDSRYDHSDVLCPKCGGPGHVLVYPQRRSWMRGRGRAQCDFCHVQFPITIVEIAEDGTEVPPWRATGKAQDAS